MKSFPAKTPVLACAGILSAMAPSMSVANAGCAPRDAVLSRLAEKYGESRQSIGLGADNSVVEVFASAETGTWSITVTSVEGVTCLVASGEAFETLADLPAVRGDDA